MRGIFGTVASKPMPKPLIGSSAKLFLSCREFRVATGTFFGAILTTMFLQYTLSIGHPRHAPNAPIMELYAQMYPSPTTQPQATSGFASLRTGSAMHSFKNRLVCLYPITTGETRYPGTPTAMDENRTAHFCEDRFHEFLSR